MQQPIRWLRAITRYRATLSGGPNFGFDLVCSGTNPQQRPGLDLSSWEVAFTGAERVQDRTLREFETAFAPYRFTRDVFCPCYGLAETTLLATGSVKGEPVVTVRPGRCSTPATPRGGNRRVRGRGHSNMAADAHRSAKPLDVVSCGIPGSGVGRADRGSRIAHRMRSGPGRGDLDLGSHRGQRLLGTDGGHTRNLSKRYSHSRSPANPPRKYLRTGDLGFLRHGHLFITGRLKDLIIVRGGNHYPSDIEQTAAASHSSLIPGSGARVRCRCPGRRTCCHRPRSATRACCGRSTIRKSCQAIRQAVVDDHLVPLQAILLVRPGSVPKTTSGKIQRREARRIYLADEFKTVASWQASDQPADVVTCRETSINDPYASDARSEEQGCQTLEQRRQVRELQQWIVSRLSARLGVPANTLDVQQPFARYGVDSLKAVRLTGELEEFLGRPVTPTLLYDYPNIAALVRYLVLGPRVPAATSENLSAVAEPIAVIGVGCRFPGGASPDAFWDLLKEGRDAIGPLPVATVG